MLCFRSAVVVFSMLCLDNASAALISSTTMFDSPSSPHFSKEDEIEAVKARTDLYTFQIQRGVDMRLVHGMLISMSKISTCCTK